MNQQKLKRLLQEYFDCTIADTDSIELLDYLSTADPDEIDDTISEEMLILNNGPVFSGSAKRYVLQRIKSDPRFATEVSKSDDEESKTIKLFPTLWLKMAAAVLLSCIVTGFYLLNHRTNGITTTNFVKSKLWAPIVPGSNKATLTLSNGKVIALDIANNGLIANTGKTNIFKSNKGQLSYKQLLAGSPLKAENTEPAYNTLTTPKGGEFQVSLPDGTKVWLNSASSLKYPTEFVGNERHVSLTGEAYFEVTKNKDKPFFVNIEKNEVKVLGTHFNIAAYIDDSDVTTTLLEGSVQVKNSNNLSLIKPGEQAVVNNGTDRIRVRPAVIDKVMAWKNGYFIFDDEDVSSIMKKISRWYDVEVEYHGNFSNTKIGGTFYRTKSINELLSHMEQVGKIHFKITGRRVIVMV